MQRIEHVEFIYIYNLWLCVDIGGQWGNGSSVVRVGEGYCCNMPRGPFHETPHISRQQCATSTCVLAVSYFKVTLLKVRHKSQVWQQVQTQHQPRCLGHVQTVL